MEFERFHFAYLLFLFVQDENNCSDVIMCRFNVVVVVGKVLVLKLKEKFTNKM